MATKPLNPARIHSPNAELAVIGSILIADIFPEDADHPNVLTDIKAILQPSDFFDERNQRLYRVMSLMAFGSIDEYTLILTLREKNLYQDGDDAFVYHCIANTPVARHGKYYAQVVKDFAERRRGIQAGTKQIQDAMKGKAQPKIKGGAVIRTANA